MNSFLIGILNVVNQVLALFLIILGTITGATRSFDAYYPIAQPWAGIVGGILGFLSGIVAAGLVCGLIAAIVSISRELTAIRLEMTVAPPAYPRPYPPEGDKTGGRRV